MDLGSLRGESASLNPPCAGGVRSAAPHRPGGPGGVGAGGDVLGVNRFGASAPGKDVLEHYGFTVPEVVHRAIQVLRGG